jgi:hypothetical protein
MRLVNENVLAAKQAFKLADGAKISEKEEWEITGGTVGKVWR